MKINRQEFIEKYDLFGCMQCSKCAGSCPESTKTTLNVRRLIYETLVCDDFSLAGREEIWDCTTCWTCALRCPKEVKPVDVVIGMRGAWIEGGKVQPIIRDTLEATFKHGNPAGRPRNKRAEWAAEADVPFLAEDPEADILFFVGCTPAYDPRIQPVSRALVRTLAAGGIRVGILGEEESCCGSEMRRLGEEGLFEMLVEDNTAAFGEYGVQRIVTLSPHCYNTLKNEYKNYAETPWEVLHYTQVLAQLIDNGKLAFSGELKRKVTYHDPCFLGKQNAVYDEPRAVLKAIPGLQFVEFDRCRERSLCCEGGGGRMWVEGTNPKERLAELRVRDAVAMGVDAIAVACPFCLLTLEDAVKTTGSEGKIEVLDVLELVSKALGEPASTEKA